MIKTNAAAGIPSPHRIMVLFLALWVFIALPTGIALAQSAAGILSPAKTDEISSPIKTDGISSPAKTAGASSPAKTDFTDLMLVSATETTGKGKEVSLGLQFKLKKGWKVYWRSPGDAGYPPQLSWKGSENLDGATIRWPVPIRYSILGFETLGYKHEVVLPITARLTDPEKPLALKLQVDYLACSDICVPYQANMELTLPAGPPKPSAYAQLINRFEVRVPGDGSLFGLNMKRAEVLKKDKRTVLRITAETSTPFSNPDIFVEGPIELQFSKPLVRLSNGNKRAIMDVPVYGIEDMDGDLVGRDLVLTLSDGKMTATTALKATAAQPGTEPLEALTGGDQTPLWVILGLALLGGLILNLMPCVLPVLSVKLLGVVGHGGGERRNVRLSFMATTAGILTGFIALAAILAGLKEAGLAVGWGIQFQQPVFLIAMTVIVTLFACNLWGFFEIRLPRWVSDMGEHSSHVHGLGGHFVTGLFAMLLSTPCSAPFLGTAVGFALSRDAGEIFAVFSVLGIGLALPYITVAVFPGVATRLPKPGHWMITLRRILGFALAATGIWLLSVLYVQVGVAATAAVALLMAAACAALFARHKWPHSLGHAGWAVVAAIAVLSFLTPSFLPRDTSGSEPPSSKNLKGLWVPFDPAKIPTLVIQGKTVFVDVTADWCITCQVNKAFVLSKGDVYKQLKSPGVIAMQADWTLPNDKIAAYLARFGRYGIPFDAVYGPGAPKGILLPEILTQGAVLKALKRAKG